MSNLSVFTFASDETQQVSQVTRAASQSRDNSQPIRGQYSGHVISIGQPEASIQGRDRDNSGPVWPQHRQIYNNLDKDKNKLDLQSAGSSPNLTYTKISALDALRIL